MNKSCVLGEGVADYLAERNIEIKNLLGKTIALNHNVEVMFSKILPFPEDPAVSITLHKGTKVHIKNKQSFLSGPVAYRNLLLLSVDHRSGYACDLKEFIEAIV